MPPHPTYPRGPTLASLCLSCLLGVQLSKPPSLTSPTCTLGLMDPGDTQLDPLQCGREASLGPSEQMGRQWLETLCCERDTNALPPTLAPGVLPEAVKALVGEGGGPTSLGAPPCAGRTHSASPSSQGHEHEVQNSLCFDPSSRPKGEILPRVLEREGYKRMGLGPGFLVLLILSQILNPTPAPSTLAKHSPEWREA